MSDTVKQTLIEDNIVPSECNLDGMEIFELVDESQEGNPCSICKEKCKHRRN